jgi:integrase/recombinase XerD
MQRLRIALIGEITALKMLTTYRAGLVARLDARGAKRLTPSTVARKLAAVRSFFRFCRLTGLTRLTSEVIAFVLKSPTATVIKPYEVLTQAEQARVLNVLEDRPRDRVLVALALGACLRASELTGVKVGDVISDDDGAHWVLVRMGKGRKDRLVPLAPDVAQVLHEYITAHKLKRDDYLITSRQGESGRMTSARVWQIVTGATQVS